MLTAGSLKDGVLLENNANTVRDKCVCVCVSISKHRRKLRQWLERDLATFGDGLWRDIRFHL